MEPASGCQEDALPVGRPRSPRRSDVDAGATCYGLPEDPKYRMDGKFPGYCLIFVMLDFYTLSGIHSEDARKRRCRQKSERIRNQFRAMGYNCNVFNNLRLDEIKRKIAEYKDKKEELSRSNSFVCWLLTCHTGEGSQIYAYQKAFRLKDLIEPFYADQCPELAGKPKLFFLEADYVKRDKEKHLCDARGGSDARFFYRIPSSADVLLGMCMGPEGEHYYDMKYAETICDVLGKRDATQPSKEFTALLNNVTKQLYTTMTKDSYKTTCFFLSTLIRDLYLPQNARYSQASTR